MIEQIEEEFNVVLDNAVKASAAKKKESEVLKKDLINVFHEELSGLASQLKFCEQQYQEAKNNGTITKKHKSKMKALNFAISRIHLIFVKLIGIELFAPVEEKAND